MASEEDRRPPIEVNPEAAGGPEEGAALIELEKLVEEARQAVKQVVKRELAGESVGDEILRFRMSLSR